MLRRLFVALNDEDFEIREMGIVIIVGRLTAQSGIHYAIASQNVSAAINGIRILNNVQGREESNDSNY